MTLSCHPLFASHVCLLLHVSKVFRLKDRGLVPNFCHIYSLESGLDRNMECWRPIGQWVYKGYLTIKFSSVLLLTPWWKDPSKMISKDAKKIAKMICLKRLGGKQIYVNNWVLLHFNPMSSNFRALFRYFSTFCTSWSSHNKCLHCSCVIF